MSEPDCEKQEPCGYPQLDCVLGVYITKCEDRIEALTAENERLEKQCEGLMQAGMNNGQALILAEAKLAKAVERLRVIDALDPEGMIDGCSQSALRGLVLRMGEISRATLAEIEGEKK
jgi:hypothetical protein